MLIMSKAAQAEIKIQKSCDRLGVSREGLFWLDHALDPFKDLVRPHPGYPDKNMDPSVVEVVKQTVVVTAPGAGNWDSSIFIDQALFTTNVYQTTTANNVWYHTGQGSTPYKRGGLVIRTANSGTSMDITTTVNSLGVDPNLYSNEECRVIGMGFEIHDTTSELKKQGSMVCWRIDQPPSQLSVISVSEDAGVTACIPASVQALYVQNPPNTMSEALDIMGSVQWEAKEGCYMVPVLTQDTNPAVRSSSVPIMVSDTNTYIPQIAVTGTAKLETLVSNNCVNPWSMCGAFISGLDVTASLTINFIYYIERFPNKSSTIRRLCYPSPPFDDMALQVYSRAARELPVGVMVKENGAGDWLMTVAKIIGGIGSMIPHPLARAGGMGINGIVTAIESSMKPKTSTPMSKSTAHEYAKAIGAGIAKHAPEVIELYNTKTKAVTEVPVSKNQVVVSNVRPSSFYRAPARSSNAKRVNRLKKATKGLVQPPNTFKKK